MTATTIRAQILNRNDTAANFTAANPTLGAGEIGFETDTKKFKFGDGTTTWSSLAYFEVGSVTSSSGDAEFQIKSTNSGGDARLKLTGDNTGLSEITFADEDDADVGLITYTHSDNSLAFKVNDGEKLRIDSSGRLLLGLTTGRAVGGSTQSLAQIETTSENSLSLVAHRGTNTAGSIFVLGKSRGSTAGSNTVVASGDELGAIRFAGADGTDVQSRGGEISCEVDGTPGSNDMPGRLVFKTTADGAASPTEHMTIKANGEVAVGTSTPESNRKLTVDIGTVSANAAVFKSQNTGGGSYIGFMDKDTTNANRVRVGAVNDDMAFITAGSEVARLDSSGNLCIGTTSASSDIHLKRTSADAILRIENTGNGNHSGIFFVREASSGESKGAANIHVESNTGGTGTALIFGCGSNTGATGAERMRITSNGTTIIGASTSVDVGSSAHAEFQVETDQNICGAFYSTINGVGPGGILALGHARGSATGVLQDNDVLGELRFAGGDGNDLETQGASIKALVDGTPGSNDMPTRLVFSTTADGSNSPTERLTISSTGDCGIGTTSPGANLDISASANPTIRLTDTAGSRGEFVYNESGSVSTLTIAADPGNASTPATDMRFTVDGSEAMRIDNNDRLLLGFTSARANFFNASDSPKLQLESTTFVDSAISVVRNVDSGAAGGIVIGKTRGTSVGSNTVVESGDSLGQVSFQGADGSEMVEAAKIAAEIDGTPGANDMPGRLVFQVTADGSSSSTERMRINSAGRTNVFGQTEVLRMRSVLASTSTSVVARFQSGATDITTGGSTRFQILANGNVQNTNNSFSAISDQKLKENIVDANSQWDDLKAIQVRNYNFIEGQTHTQIGVVAQEVETVSPGLVFEVPDTDDDGNDLGTATKSVNYSVLYMKAVKALQEAMDRIETLEAKVAALEAQ